MEYKVNKNIKFSIDGVTVLEFVKDQIITNPDEETLAGIGDSCKPLTVKRDATDQLDLFNAPPPL